MKIFSVSSKGGYATTFYWIIVIITSIVIGVISVYAVATSILYHVNIVGETLVLAPTGRVFEFPQTEYFPIYAKPVTYVYVALIALVYATLHLAKNKLLRLRIGLHIFKFVAFLAVTVSAYEVLYNFTIWGAQMAAASIGSVTWTPDILITKYPNPNFPWNLLFATKIFTALFIASGYALYFLRNIDKEVTNGRAS